MDLKLIKSKDIKELKQELQNIKNDNAELHEEWLNTEEAALFLKISIRTLKRYREAGRIPYSKDVRIFRFKKSDLITYIKNKYVSVSETNK